MGAGHATRDTAFEVRTAPRVRAAALFVLILVAIVTGVGVVQFWPDYGAVAKISQQTGYLADGVALEAGEIVEVDACEPPEQAAPQGEAPTGAQSACELFRVSVQSGPDRGQLVEVEAHGAMARSGLGTGDRVELYAFGESSGQPHSYGLANNYELSGAFRHVPLAILAAVFALVVIAVGRLRGLLALVALVVAGVVLVGFVLPALISGAPPLPVGLIGASAIMLVTLFFVHGPNMRTTSALLGTLAGLLIMALVSWLSVQASHLSGLGDESSGLLSTATTGMDFRGLLSCSILIAGLGVLNDVTITQASAVWELRAAAPTMPQREVFARAMRIGRDHIASTVYTVCFAYAGAALSVLLLLYLYNRPVLSLLTSEDLAVEIVRTLAGSIGLVLAVPITTVVAALFVPPRGADSLQGVRDRAATPRAQ